MRSHFPLPEPAPAAADRTSPDTDDSTESATAFGGLLTYIEHPGAGASPDPAPRHAADGSPESVAVDNKKELSPSTVYLGSEEDDFLEDVRAAGRRRPQRVDANRSAVVRLALNRLAEQLTHGEVVEEIHRQGKVSRGPRGHRNI
ncbi:hypothetical protein [Prescottella subtropica]|uniref:hypothetical protein n=1 Tax=Prescottella subtropica TaxID=2545757 RepID=UPI0010FA035E|nr:hypothetical protein [Prescottella subtropica]